MKRKQEQYKKEEKHREKREFVEKISVLIQCLNISYRPQYIGINHFRIMWNTLTNVAQMLTRGQEHRMLTLGL